jgi:putative ABC transport system permease protein
VRPRVDPPSFAQRLLAAALTRAEYRDTILGDLHEEFGHVAMRTSPAHARRWYWREALRLGCRYALKRRAPNAAASPAPIAGDSLMSMLVHDIRIALRVMLKRPAATILVAITLALGIGANAAVFGIIDALVLRPFTLPDVDRIVLVSETAPDERYTQETVSPANFLDWRKQADVFEHLAAFAWWDVNLIARGEPMRAQGMFVSTDFFDTVGIRPALGRAFTAEEGTPGHDRRVVLSDGLWRRRFGADPSIVGQAITLDGQPYDVVGVTPHGFDFPVGTEIWAPLAFDAKTAAERTRRYLTVVGRLRSPRDLEAAQVQMAVVADRLERDHPESNRLRGARVYTLATGMLDQGTGPILAMWQVSAGIVLLIACANVANLLLARGADRQREIAVRLAIGATRARVIGELLVESTLLAMAAVPVSLLVAWMGVRAVRVNLPARLVRYVAGWETMSLDGRVIALTIGLAFVTAFVFGALPALRGSRPRLSEALKDGGRTATAGRQRLRRALLVAEIAIALPLLVAAALSVIGTTRFLNGPQGYDPAGLLAMKLVLPDKQYGAEESRRQFAARLVEEAVKSPGASGAAIANVVPAAGATVSRAIEIDGRPNADPANPPTVDVRSVTMRYFDVMRIPLVDGRAFSEDDRAASDPVAIVSRSLAEKYWPDTSALGRRLRLDNGVWRRVVGISGDVIHDWFDRRNAPTVYQPYAQRPTSNFVLLVRTAGDPLTLAPSALHALKRVDPVQPAFDVMPMSQVLREKTIGLQYVTATMLVFAAIALMLALVGVYAVMAFLVTQRRHEMGVRIALGATPRDVVALGIGQAGRLAAIGVAIGLALSIALGRLMEAGLLGVVSADLRVSAAFAIGLMLAALVAGYVPARRAAAVDPATALRAE